MEISKGNDENYVQMDGDSCDSQINCKVGKCKENVCRALESCPDNVHTDDCDSKCELIVNVKVKFVS